MSSQVAILTGGGDRPYALGLASALSSAGVALDFIGSDELESPNLRNDPNVRVFNLRGSMGSNVSMPRKVLRVAKYYARLFGYAVTAKPRVFHVLWNNKLEVFDRTLLLCYYKFLGRRIVLTVHNVNIGKRDGNDSFLNRVTLQIQYRLADHLFVHTKRMARELQSDFGVPAAKVTVIPFGINSTVPNTSLTTEQARDRLQLSTADKVLLFFGNIAKYKGLDYLIEAMPAAAAAVPALRLIIAGRPKGAEQYWEMIERRIAELGIESMIIKRIQFVPDDETEIYFKAADALVLPYTHVFQSGVLFLGYNFGTPAIVTDVGALKEEIVEGATGYVCPPSDPVSLADAIKQYFASEVFANLSSRRPQIRQFAADRYSWESIAAISASVYHSVANLD